MTESPENSVNLAGLLRRLNAKLALEDQKLFAESDDSGRYYVVNRLTNKRVERGLTVDKLVKLARGLSALREDEKFNRLVVMPRRVDERHTVSATTPRSVR